MFKTKVIFSLIVFVTFLVITSTIKNETRIIENISTLNSKILIKKNNINEAHWFFTLHHLQKLKKNKYNWF